MERKICEDLTCRGMVRKEKPVQKYDPPCRWSARHRSFGWHAAPAARLIRPSGLSFPYRSSMPRKGRPKHYRTCATSASRACSRSGLLPAVASTTGGFEPGVWRSGGGASADCARKFCASASALSDRRSPLSRLTNVIPRICRSSKGDALQMYQRSSASFSVADKCAPPFT
jgi:hypothetical protein